MKKLKEVKGITLVALIITIVVLLILAMVAIGTLQESNIIGHAQNAAGSFNQAKVNEISLLEQYEKEIEDKLPKEEPIWGEWNYEGTIYLCYLGNEKDLKVTSDKIKVQEITVDFEAMKYTRVEGTEKETIFSSYECVFFLYTAPYIETIDFGNILSSNNNVRVLGCENIKEVKGLGGIATIKRNDFGYCSIINLEIPESVTVIEDGAFEYSENLTEITIKRNQSDAEAVLGTDWIPESVTKIIYNDATVTR